jgi:hypothetical protein
MSKRWVKYRDGNVKVVDCVKAELVEVFDGGDAPQFMVMRSVISVACAEAHQAWAHQDTMDQ